jgi:Fur family ferric uptake transcriptional regulator
MVKELENDLLAKGIRPTAMRLLVLEYLLKQTAAVRINDLETYFLKADRITLYRTLKTFEEKGLVHKIEDGTASVKYALCPDSCSGQAHHDLHLHFYCIKCAATFCLPKTRIPELQLPENYQAEEINLTVKGKCSSCSK